MSSEDELAQLAAEEASLQFSAFNAETAWALGTALKQEAERRGVAVSIDIQLAGHTLFHYAMREHLRITQSGYVANVTLSAVSTKVLMPSGYVCSCGMRH